MCWLRVLCDGQLAAESLLRPAPLLAFIRHLGAHAAPAAAAAAAADAAAAAAADGHGDDDAR
jgi:hypothetical protein